MSIIRCNRCNVEKCQERLGVIPDRYRFRHGRIRMRMSNERARALLNEWLVRR
jgi:hypothetical protein